MGSNSTNIPFTPIPRPISQRRRHKLALNDRKGRLQAAAERIHRGHLLLLMVHLETA
jgi:hypothetical protein